MAQPNISTKELAKFKIPLPSLSEQKAIVAKLDRAQRLIDIDKEMLAKYDELIQSVFLEMFGDPVTNPKGWELEKGKTLFNFKSGKYIKKDLLDDNFEFPVYGGNGVRGCYDDFLVDYPTLIIGRVGAKCGVVHSIKNKSWITDNAIFLEDFAYPNKINFYYTLLKLLNINQYADYSGQPKITQEPLKNLDVINPSEDLILHFEKVYSQIIDEKKKLKSSLIKSEELFSSLVQEAFG
ncbi:MAG: restriction endonuclease subunit S [Balneolaceae bacterium]|nr:restriction endonuclease subunit S [Balneolaceae bacterium]